VSNLFVRVELSDRLLGLPIRSLMLKHPSIKQITIKIDKREFEVGLKMKGRLSRREMDGFKCDLRVLLGDEELISEG